MQLPSKGMKKQGAAWLGGCWEELGGGMGREKKQGEKARAGMVWGLLGGAERRYGKEQDSQCRERCDFDSCPLFCTDCLH